MAAESGEQSLAVIELSCQDAVARVTLTRDSAPRIVELAGQRLRLQLVSQFRPLGVSVELLDFRRTTNPGGVGDAAIALQVRCRDLQAGDEHDHLVAVNQPARVGAFKLTYLDAQQRDGKVTQVTLAVTSDPGRRFKYLGVTVICLGMVLSLVLQAAVTREDAP